MSKKDFSLKELNDIKDFVSEWKFQIQHDISKKVDVDLIGDDIIRFAIKTDYIDVNDFDEIATDNMQPILYKFLDWLQLDFGYTNPYGDGESVDGYVYIDFVVW